MMQTFFLKNVGSFIKSELSTKQLALYDFVLIIKSSLDKLMKTFYITVYYKLILCMNFW